MIVADLVELTLYPVEDRGAPNSERIPILVQTNVDMGQYGVMVGHAQLDGSAIPYLDTLYWFGNGVLHRGDWVFLYTGAGEPQGN